MPPGVKLPFSPAWQLRAVVIRPVELKRHKKPRRVVGAPLDLKQLVQTA
jgi:hypothetical protein